MKGHTEHRFFAPDAGIQLAMALVTAACVLGIFAASLAFAGSGIFGIPGPINPDPLAYAIEGGQLDDYVGRSLYVMECDEKGIIIACELEGRSLVRTAKFTTRRGLCDRVTVSELAWTGAGWAWPEIVYWSGWDDEPEPNMTTVLWWLHSYEGGWTGRQGEKPIR